MSHFEIPSAAILLMVPVVLMPSVLAIKWTIEIVIDRKGWSIREMPLVVAVWCVSFAAWGGLLRMLHFFELAQTL